MACLDYLKASGETIHSFENQIPADSFNCLLQHHEGLCKAFCTDPTKNWKGCMQCLSDKSLCRITPSGESGSENAKPCCPHVAEAFKCLDCTAENPTDVSKCTKRSHKEEYIIGGSVGGFVLLLIVGVAVYFAIKKRREQSESVSVDTGATAAGLSTTADIDLRRAGASLGASQEEIQNALRNG